jgi:hypothetical protein
VHEIAEHFDAIRKPIYVFYLGDHDPSGREVEIDLEERVRSQLNRAREDGEKIVLSRLAIHSEDIRNITCHPCGLNQQIHEPGDFSLSTVANVWNWTRFHRMSYGAGFGKR